LKPIVAGIERTTTGRLPARRSSTEEKIKSKIFFNLICSKL
jgi:hypothetical protein